MEQLNRTQTLKVASLFRRHGLSAIYLTLMIIAPVVLTSLVVTGVDFNSLIQLDNFLSFLKNLLICSVSLLISYSAFNLKNKGEGQQIKHVFGKDMFLKPLIYSLVIAIGLVLLLNFGHWAEIHKHAGGLFDILLGVFTIVGLFLTLSELLDRHNTIVSFPDLLSRVEELIESTDKEDIVEMMVLTPAMGCMVLRCEEWNRVQNQLNRTDRRISLTTLKLTTMEEWFSQYSYLYNNTNDLKRLKENGLQASKNVIDNLIHKYEKTMTDGCSDEKLKPVLGDFSNCPRTYMIANRTKAIMAVPLFMPTPTYQPSFEGHEGKTRVQFIGFETHDFHLIESVKREIASHRAYIQKQQEPKPVS